MREERDAQYIRAIEGGVVDDAPPSRRRRHKVLAVDRDGDIAAVLIADRGKRRNGHLTPYLFERREGSWEPLGGGGSGTDDPRTPDRSTIPPRSIQSEGRGASGSGRSAIHDAVIRAGADIETLRWRERYRTVSPTGYAVVVWRGPADARRHAYDAHMRLVDELEGVRIRSPFARLPWRVPVRRALTSWRHKGEWFDYAPRR